MLHLWSLITKLHQFWVQDVNGRKLLKNAENYTIFPTVTDQEMSWTKTAECVGLRSIRDFTPNKWRHKQMNMRKNLLCGPPLSFRKSLSSLKHCECWLPCPPTVCWLHNCVRICEQKKKKKKYKASASCWMKSCSFSRMWSLVKMGCFLK